MANAPYVRVPVTWIFPVAPVKEIPPGSPMLINEVAALVNENVPAPVTNEVPQSSVPLSVNEVVIAMLLLRVSVAPELTINVPIVNPPELLLV